MSTDPTAIYIDAYGQRSPFKRRMRGYAVWGHTPFDVPFISHVEGNLFQGGCENGLVLPDLFEHVASLYPWERYTVEHELKSFREFWLYDSVDISSPGELADIVDYVHGRAEDGPTLVHCQAGLNRSALIASLVLVKRGRTPEDAIALLREKRSPAVLCNTVFEEYVLRQS